MVDRIGELFPASRLEGDALLALRQHLQKCPESVKEFQSETLDGFLYYRQVTCPNCGGEAPQPSDHYGRRFIYHPVLVYG